MPDEDKASGAAGGGMTVEAAMAWVADVSNTCGSCWDVVTALVTQVRRLRESNRIYADNFGKAQLEIAKLQTKLARVEAFPKLIRARARDLGDARLSAEAELVCVRIEQALRDPQPSAEEQGPDLPSQVENGEKK